MAGAYGIRQGLRLWLLAVAAFGAGACGGAIDGGGGIDVGSALVDIALRPAEPREGVIDSRLDGIDPKGDAMLGPQAVSIPSAFWGFRDIRFGTSDRCQSQSGDPARVVEQVLRFDSVVIWPAGIIVPPAYDLEITGQELCYVQLSFARSETYEAFVANAVLADGQKATYVSEQPLIVRAQLHPARAIATLGEFALALSVPTEGWFEGAQVWSLLGGNYYWSGGREEEARIRQNIVEGMRANLQPGDGNSLNTAAQHVELQLMDLSYDVTIDP